MQVSMFLLKSFPWRALQSIIRANRDGFPGDLTAEDVKALQQVYSDWFLVARYVFTCFCIVTCVFIYIYIMFIWCACTRYAGNFECMVVTKVAVFASVCI